MSDFQGRRPADRAPFGTAGGLGDVHQVVFRWDGNQGRQGTGMTAVAHSCSAGRAEELGRELGSLLWVSGTASPRPSVVRTLSRDGDVMLVQRWPTTDRGGRPSTVSHALIGDPRFLKTRQCLGLAYGGWGTQESAEAAAGPLDTVDCAKLDAVARRRLPAMRELLPTVQHAVTLVTAEWLRDPTQRVSLLTNEENPPRWPDRDAMPVAYLGLFLLFGSWLGEEWTFATYDTVDTHQLRLMCVPRWEPDSGGSGPLARVMGRPPAQPQFEHRAAARLVDHVLTHPADGPGVPQLVDRLSGGAALDWPRRRALLKDVLDAERRSGPRTTTTAPPRPAEPEPDVAPTLVPTPPQPDPVPPPPPPTPVPAPQPAPPPTLPTTPPTPTPPPVRPSAPRPAAPTTGPPAVGHETPALQEDLRAPRRRNAVPHGRPTEDLYTLPDQALLDELRSGELSQEAMERVLNELGDEDRVRARGTAMRHELCAEVLRNDLYLTWKGPGAEPASRMAMAHVAADLFGWAVAPLARDERYLIDLQELLHRVCLDRHPAAGNWLWESIIAPTSGRAPDLPPVLWQQILRDVITAPSTTTHAPSTTQASHAPHASPEPSTVAPERRTSGSRFSELTSSPGCVVGTGFGVIIVLLALALIFA